MSFKTLPPSAHPGSLIEREHINPSLLTLATLCYCLKITLPKLFEGVKDTLAPT